MRISSIVFMTVAMIGFGWSDVVAQSRVVSVPATEYGNVFTVAFTRLDDIPESPLYLVSVCGPRESPGEILKSFSLRLRNSEGIVRFSVTAAAVVDDDFAVVEVNIAPSEVEDLQIFAEYFRGPRARDALFYVDTVDLSFLRDEGEGHELGVHQYALSCQELVEAAGGVAE